MKLTHIIAILLVAGLPALAAPDTTITNYLPGYVLVPNTFTNAGDTGLDTNATAYACIPVSLMAYCTEDEAAASGGTSDVRAVVFSINKVVYEAVSALVSTNQFDIMTFNEHIKSGTSADIGITHTITTEIDLGTTTLPSE